MQSTRWAEFNFYVRMVFYYDLSFTSGALKFGCCWCHIVLLCGGMRGRCRPPCSLAGNRVQDLTSGLNCLGDSGVVRVAALDAAPDDVACVHTLGTRIAIDVACCQCSWLQALELLGGQHHRFRACAPQNQSYLVAVIHAEVPACQLVGIVTGFVLPQLFALAALRGAFDFRVACFCCARLLCVLVHGRTPVFGLKSDGSGRQGRDCQPTPIIAQREPQHKYRVGNPFLAGSVAGCCADATAELREPQRNRA